MNPKKQPKPPSIIKPGEEKIRSFIAVPIPEQMRQAIGGMQNTLKKRGMVLRWVKPENLHYTIKFLGNISPDIVDPLSEKLKELAAASPRFTMRLGGIGAFPNMRQAKVFWIGLQAGSGELIQLAGQVSRIAGEFPTEADNKRFKPHLTIGRVKGRPSGRWPIPESFFKDSLGECECERILLMKSTLAPGGSIYEVLSDNPLQ
jgi:2'-5' RNA ligase